MKEEIARIMRLVQEGKISPEDAAELIDAFQTSEGQQGPAQESWSAGPPPPPSGAGVSPPPPPGSAKDPFRTFMDSMEHLGRDVTQNINWHDVAKQIREGAQKGADAIRQSVEQIKTGKVNFGWLSASETREVTLPISNVGAKTLKVENPCGDVRISGGFEQCSVSARAQIRGADQEDAHEKAEQYTVIVEESDHQLIIRQPDVSGLSVDLVIQIKDAAHVEVRTSSGDVMVTDTGGGCRVNNQSGDISLRGLNGAIEVITQNGDLSVQKCLTPSLSIENKSGDVNIEEVEGNLNARSSNGDVNVKRSSGKSISVESINGDVDVSLSDPITGTVNIRTVNGDAQVALPDYCDCRVTLSTLRGDVSCEVNLEDESRMEKRITGRLGEGNGSLDVSAVNGDVKLALGS